MASAIPAAIGVGSSLVGGISGKGAAKEQRKLAERQLAMLQPLINAQIQASQFGLDQARQLYGPAAQMFQQTYDTALADRDTAMGGYNRFLEDAFAKEGELYGEGRSLSAQGRGILTGAQPYLQGAATALSDLQRFYRPFMDSGQRAIDAFLPSASRIGEVYASDFGNVNQGYRSASENIARFAPRGGGRVSTLARMDIDRQKQISDIFFQGKNNLRDLALGKAFEGAAGTQNVSNALQSLGLGQGQLGLGTIGQGLATSDLGRNFLSTGGQLAQNAYGQGLQALGLGINSAQGTGNLATTGLQLGLSGGQGPYSLYNQQNQQAFNSTFGGSGGDGKGLGGYLVDLFNNKSIQNKINDIFGVNPANTRPRTVS
jgi:hypothetical protein